MSNPENINKQNIGGSKKMLLAMVSIGIISALLIVSAFQVTLPRVERLKAEALEKAIFEVLPGTVSTQAYGINPDGEVIKINKGDKKETIFYAGYDDNDHITGYAIKASGQGYADVIHVLYGYEPKKEILIGFQVLESKETPGLGDKIEKDIDFINNFKALDVSLSDQSELKNEVITVKHGEKSNPWEIDGITGATISSRAIGSIIGKSTSKLIPILHEHYIKNELTKKE